MAAFFKKCNLCIAICASAILLVCACVYFLQGTLSVPFQIMLQIAFYGIAYFILINGVRILKSFKRRFVREATSMVILIPLVFGVCVMAYAIAAQYTKRFDFTIDKKFSLSPQTIKIVRTLSEGLTIKCFYQDAQNGREFLKTLLAQYQLHSPLLQVEFIDPDKNPQMAKQYAVENYGEIVVVSGDRQEKIGEDVSEETITNAMLHVTSEREKVVYFVVGHGECAVEDTDSSGLFLLQKHLAMENYVVKELSLIRTSAIPGDAAAIVIAAPRTDFFDEEIALLKAYIAHGAGGLLFLGDRETPLTVREFIETYGVDIDQNVIVDKMSQLFGASYEVCVVTKYGDHEITKNFNVASFLPTASSISLQDIVPSGVNGCNLAYSGPGSWGETNLSLLREGQAVLEKEDRMGPMPVSVALTYEPESGETISVDATRSAAKSRCVFFGDADFVTNKHLKLSGNKDFFFNALAWVCGDMKLISIRPREIESTPLYLRAAESKLLFFVPVICFPLACIAIGVVQFIRRRRVQ